MHHVRVRGLAAGIAREAIVGVGDVVILDLVYWAGFFWFCFWYIGAVFVAFLYVDHLMKCN